MIPALSLPFHAPNLLLIKSHPKKQTPFSIALLSAFGISILLYPITSLLA